MTVGLDANILCYALDDAYLELEKTKQLLLNLSSENRIAVNPTIIHETYHVLVYSQKWLPQDASNALKILLKNPYLEFFSQTKNISQIALSLSVHYNLGGRDGLIAANFLANRLTLMYTHEKELVVLKKIKWKNSTLNFQDPIS